MNVFVLVVVNWGHSVLCPRANSGLNEPGELQRGQESDWRVSELIIQQTRSYTMQFKQLINLLGWMRFFFFFLGRCSCKVWAVKFDAVFRPLSQACRSRVSPLDPPRKDALWPPGNLGVTTLWPQQLQGCIPTERVEGLEPRGHKHTHSDKYMHTHNAQA